MQSCRQLGATNGGADGGGSCSQIPWRPAGAALGAMERRSPSRCSRWAQAWRAGATAGQLVHVCTRLNAACGGLPFALRACAVFFGREELKDERSRRAQRM